MPLTDFQIAAEAVGLLWSLLEDITPRPVCLALGLIAGVWIEHHWHLVAGLRALGSYVIKSGGFLR